MNFALFICINHWQTYSNRMICSNATSSFFLQHRFVDATHSRSINNSFLYWFVWQRYIFAYATSKFRHKSIVRILFGNNKNSMMHYTQYGQYMMYSSETPVFIHMSIRFHCCDCCLCRIYCFLLLALAGKPVGCHAFTEAGNRRICIVYIIGLMLG